MEYVQMLPGLEPHKHEWIYGIEDTYGWQRCEVCAVYLVFQK